ncbi:hypothetical protein SR39_03060 [Methylobacterium radiotolerans]|nr:hypothetical protein SR39_03060 [Methylobacterium radiotolerans]
MNSATGAMTTTRVGSDRPVTKRKTSSVWPLAVTRSSSRRACVSQMVPVSPIRQARVAPRAIRKM